MICPLCESHNIIDFARDEKRSWDYWQCELCDLVFRDPQSYLNLLQEKARYQTHNNSLENTGYVKFLSPVVETLHPYLAKKDLGLDYGCGPGPILNHLFSEFDVKIDLYDPFFYPDTKDLKNEYDFITCTEVAEHFYSPGSEFVKLNALLKPGGYLLVMTEMRPENKPFIEWGYRMDSTHVCFYSEKVLQWVAKKMNYEILSLSRRIVLFQKPVAQPVEVLGSSVDV